MQFHLGRAVFTPLPAVTDRSTSGAHNKPFRTLIHGACVLIDPESYREIFLGRKLRSSDTVMVTNGWEKAFVLVAGVYMLRLRRKVLGNFQVGSPQVQHQTSCRWPYANNNKHFCVLRFADGGLVHDISVEPRFKNRKHSGLPHVSQRVSLKKMAPADPLPY